MNFYVIDFVLYKFIFLKPTTTSKWKIKTTKQTKKKTKQKTTKNKNAHLKKWSMLGFRGFFFCLGQTIDSSTSKIVKTVFRPEMKS